MGTGMIPDKLFKKFDEIERKYTLKELKEKARLKGLSPSGTKREIVIRLFGKHARDYRPPAAPMISAAGRKRLTSAEWKSRGGRKCRT